MVLKGDSTVVELESAHMKVSTRLIDAYNSLETPAQTFTRLTVVLTRETFPQQFQKLAEGGKAIFPLSWDNPVVVDKLHDYAHILVSSCRIHLPLARKAKTSGDVHVLVMHSGQSAIFDSKGKRWDFSHVITSIYYDYNVESKEQKKEVKPTSDSDYVYNTRIKKTVGYKYNVEHMTDKGGGTFCPQDKRIKISPLAVWAIKIPKDSSQNRGVDCSKVNEIYIHFAGQNEAFVMKGGLRRQGAGDWGPAMQAVSFERPSETVVVI